MKGVGMLGLMLLGLDRLPCVSLAMLAQCLLKGPNTRFAPLPYVKA